MTLQHPFHPASGRRQERRGRPFTSRPSLPPHAVVALLVVVSLLPVNVELPAAQPDQVGEYELKAAILYNLSRFVEWPASAYSDPQAPTILCVLGQDPFGGSLTAVIQKQDANSRPVSIRRLKNQTGIRGCHVLYISSSERKAIAQIFSTLKGSSVLTVGEMSQFAARGGVVQFTLEERQVRFDINVDAASRMGLKISSRLLVLARIVKDQDRNLSRSFKPANAQPFTIAAALFPFPAVIKRRTAATLSRIGCLNRPGADG